MPPFNCLQYVQLFCLFVQFDLLCFAHRQLISSNHISSVTNWRHDSMLLRTLCNSFRPAAVTRPSKQTNPPSSRVVSCPVLPTHSTSSLSCYVTARLFARPLLNSAPSRVELASNRTGQDSTAGDLHVASLLRCAPIYKRDAHLKPSLLGSTANISQRLFQVESTPLVQRYVLSCFYFDTLFLSTLSIHNCTHCYSRSAWRPTTYTQLFRTRHNITSYSIRSAHSYTA